MTKKRTLTTKLIAVLIGLAACIAFALGIAFASFAPNAHAEGTDTRIKISEIQATSNIEEVVGYGKDVVLPSFIVADGLPVRLGTHRWTKYDGSEWIWNEDATFAEGKYRYKVQIRTDNTTHVLDKDGVTLTVNGENWTEDGKAYVGDNYSWDWFFSREYEITAPIGAPVGFIKNDAWDLKNVYEGRAIPTFSVASGATGGTKPYTFSKVTGPDWIEVAADGTVSGTPTALGTNADLVIRVTDSTSTTAEITLAIADTIINPDDRIKISEIQATSNIEEVVGYGKDVVLPSFIVADGLPVRLGTHRWAKYDGSEWIWNEDVTFAEGKYRYKVQIRTDNTTHVLDKDGVTLTVNGENWTKDGNVSIGDNFSWVWFYSREYEITKPTAAAITEALVPVTDLTGKAYNETAQEPTFGGTLVRGTDYEVSYAVKAGAGGALDFGGKPVGAGTYVVTVTGKGAYEGSFTKEFLINKAEQSAPVGFFANPISCRDGSGTIVGVTTAMEYKKVGDADYTKCTSSTITNLAAGEYEVRYAEDENYLASGVATVTVAVSHNFGALIEATPATCSAPGMKAHYYCSDCGKYFDENKNETTEEALTIPATGVHTFGTLIEEQPATCIAGGMKAHYKCTVCGKYFDENKNETTEEALKTPISPYYGHSFGFWVEEEYATCQAPGRKGYKHCSICDKYYDASNKEITDFVIPVNPDGHELGDLVAEVPATCKDTGVKAHRDCNLCGKHCDPITRKEIADLTIPTTNNHTYGELIPEVPATTTEFGVKEHKDCTVCGRHFDKDGNEITELRIAKIGTHNVVINGESKFYAHGESVTVTANEPAEGKVFKGWKDESGKIVSTEKSYTFTVNGETTLTAVYEDKSSGGGEITPPAKKDGLSGGQIAGIVIGSVAVAGIGGFAFLWFAVKKKAFADLIAAIKALFTKKK